MIFFLKLFHITQFFYQKSTKATVIIVAWCFFRFKSEWQTPYYFIYINYHYIRQLCIACSLSPANFRTSLITSSFSGSEHQASPQPADITLGTGIILPCTFFTYSFHFHCIRCIGKGNNNFRFFCSHLHLLRADYKT